MDRAWEALRRQSMRSVLSSEEWEGAEKAERKLEDRQGEDYVSKAVTMNKHSIFKGWQRYRPSQRNLTGD